MNIPGSVVKRGSVLLLRLSASLYQPFNSMNNTPGRALRQGAEPRRAHHIPAYLSLLIILPNTFANYTILLTYNIYPLSLYFF